LVVDIEYFIAVCVLLVVVAVIETVAYTKALRERDAFATVLEMYIKKFGQQTFNVDGEEFRIE